jgi:hypothetical protein
MDWEGLRERTLGEVANTLVAEGVGVGAGFVGASTIGRRVEDYMLPAGVDIASWSSILKGWTYNNAPKLAIWYVIRRYVPETPETRTQEMLMDAKKAIAGSVVFDTLLRTTNHGKPVHDPSSYKLLGGKGEEVRTAAPQADTQRLIQENSALRTELNKALQRLAAPVQAQAQQPIYVQVPASQPTAPVVRYQPTMAQEPVRTQTQPAPVPEPVRTQAQPVVRIEQQQTPSPIIERQRRFAFMPTNDAPPEVHEREKRYGFAGKSSEKEIASMFGML